MASDTTEGDTTLPPDEAFGVLGNGTRMEILQALGATEEALAFSELYDRVDVRDSSRFNYHLDKLTGHFVKETDEGYALRGAGRRVIEAVLSGAVTEAPEIEWTRIDEACHLCGAPIAIRYAEERISVCCTACDGTYPDSFGPLKLEVPAEYGYLGDLMMPPAGVEDRSPGEAFRAAWTLSNLELFGMGSGVCPRCSAPIEHSITVCEDHETTNGRCGNCNRRPAVYFGAECETCNYGHHGGFALGLGTETTLLSVLIEHGINPIVPDSDGRETMDRLRQDYDEEIVDRDPLRLRFTFTVGDDELTLTVDDELDVIETTVR